MKQGELHIVIPRKSKLDTAITSALRSPGSISTSDTLYSPKRLSSLPNSRPESPTKNKIPLPNDASSLFIRPELNSGRNRFLYHKGDTYVEFHNKILAPFSPSKAKINQLRAELKEMKETKLPKISPIKTLHFPMSDTGSISPMKDYPKTSREKPNKPIINEEDDMHRLRLGMPTTPRAMHRPTKSEAAMHHCVNSVIYERSLGIEYVFMDPNKIRLIRFDKPEPKSERKKKNPYLGYLDSKNYSPSTTNSIVALPE